MAVPAFNRKLGMLLLAFWLVLSGLTDIFAVPLPALVLPILAVLAGALILLGE